MTSLGSQIGQFVERRRAEQAVRDADARKSAILNAAFDCVVTMDHNGDIVEVNKATERTFGYTAEQLMGHELAALMIPPDLREAHRSALRRYIDTGQSRVINHPIELRGMRADGSEFPVELAITRPDLPGPALFCGYLRDVTERHRSEKALRRLAAEQAALRRVATAVAATIEPAHVFSVVTEEVGRLLGAQTANMVRYDGQGSAAVVGGWNAEGVRSVPVGDFVRLDGDTVAARVWRTQQPSRVDSYDDMAGTLAESLREPRLPLRGRGAGVAGRPAVGRGDRLQRQPRAVPARRRAAARRLRGAGHAGARQRAGARGAGGVARADRRGRRCRAAAARAQPARRRAAAARLARAQPAARRARLRARRRDVAVGVRARRRGAIPGARGAARAGARDPPGGAQRPRPGAGDRVARRAHRRPRDVRDRARGPPARAGRGRRLLRGGRGADQRRQALARLRGVRADRARRRLRPDRGGRRRGRRRDRRRRIGPARARRPGRGARRAACELESPLGEGTTVRAEIPSR